MRLAPTAKGTTVLLTMAVGILSLVTGIVYLGSPVVLSVLEPFAPDVVRAVVGFTGALTGFLLLLSASGLRRGLRAAWFSTLLLLPAAALQGLLQSSPFSFPLVILSIVAIPSVYRQRGRFRRSTELTDAQLAAGAALGGVLAYGSVGSFVLREDYAEIETPLDAFYYTIVTATTVGYGDAVPETQIARWFALSVVILGPTSFILAGGVLLGPVLESRFKAALGKMTSSKLETLDDHVLLLGVGEMTPSILDELHDRTQFLVVTGEQSVASRLQESDVDVLVKDPGDLDALRSARVERARAVIVASNSDGDDALAILTVRRLSPDVHIVAGASNRQNIEKLRDAGADTVISATAIGSHLLADAALKGESVEQLNVNDAAREHSDSS